ncbi:hypothetical protein MTO96_005854 [Rhipicephalus appendiculatus]
MSSGTSVRAPVRTDAWRTKPDPASGDRSFEGWELWRKSVATKLGRPLDLLRKSEKWSCIQILLEPQKTVDGTKTVKNDGKISTGALQYSAFEVVLSGCGLPADSAEVIPWTAKSLGSRSQV